MIGYNMHEQTREGEGSYEVFHIAKFDLIYVLTFILGWLVLPISYIFVTVPLTLSYAMLHPYEAFCFGNYPWW